MKLATAQDMRTMDELAVKEHGLTIAGLMEAAGAGVVSAVEEEYGPLKGKSIGVLCGKGNNGGDALVVVRLLKQKKLAVNAVVLGEAEKLSSEAQKQYQKVKLAKAPLLHVIDAKSLKTAGDSLG